MKDKLIDFVRNAMRSGLRTQGELLTAELIANEALWRNLFTANTSFEDATAAVQKIMENFGEKQ